MFHDGFTRCELFVAQCAVSITQLNAHTSSELQFPALLAAVLFVLYSKMQIGHGEHIPYFHIGWVLHAVLFGKSATLLPGLLAVNIGGIDTDPSENKEAQVLLFCILLLFWLLVSTVPLRCVSYLDANLCALVEMQPLLIKTVVN